MINVRFLLQPDQCQIVRKGWIVEAGMDDYLFNADHLHRWLTLLPSLDKRTVRIRYRIILSQTYAKTKKEKEDKLVSNSEHLSPLVPLAHI